MVFVTAFFNEIISIYHGLCWFIAMSLGYAFHIAKPFYIMVPVLLAAIPTIALYFKSKTLNTSYITMTALWICIGLWGLIFRDRHPDLHWPEYMTYSVLMILAVFVIYGVYRIFKNKNFRILTFVTFVANAYFAVVMTLLAGMSISGAWL